MTTDASDAAALTPAAVADLFGFDPYDPAVKTDPYPTYRKLFSDGPIVRSEWGVVEVGSLDLCSQVLRSLAFGTGDGEMVESQFSTDPEGNTVRPFNFADPPEHTRLRTLAGKALSPALVEGLRPRARQLADELLDTARKESAGQPIDLISALADPLSSTLLRELLGIPGGDQGPFLAWSKALGRGLDPDMLLTREEIATRDQARDQFHDYFRAMAVDRRANPAHDLVSALVNVTGEAGDKLTETEVVVTCTFVVGAGEVTTVNLIGLATLSLLRNPDQFDWLRAHRDQVGNAVEELLRYDGPTQFLLRQVLEDTTVGPLEVAAGDAVALLIGAANHDPAVYDNPDTLDLSRPRGRALGFGLGIHFCFGAPLARLTTQVALNTLAGLDLELAGEPTFTPNLGIRGLASLPVFIR